MRLFEEILEGVQRDPEHFPWQTASQRIVNNSDSLKLKYARTLAAFGVEVLDPNANDTQLIVGVVVVRFQDQIIRTGKSRVEGTSTKSFDICTTLCSILGTSTRGS